MLTLCAERKAEWLGNDNRKTMIKVKTTGQILPFKNGTALPSPSQAPGWALPCYYFRKRSEWVPVRSNMIRFSSIL